MENKSYLHIRLCLIEDAPQMVFEGVALLKNFLWEPSGCPLLFLILGLGTKEEG